MLLILLSLIFHLLNPSAVFAQDQTSFNVAFDQYRAAESNYTLKRGAYMASNTLAAQAEAQEATYQLMQTRDGAILSYLLMLQSRLNEATGVEDIRALFSTQLTTEVDWFTNHRQTLSNSASLDDMISDSKEAQDRYEKTTLLLVYRVMSQIAIGKESFLRLKQTSIINELKNKVNIIKNENIIDNVLVERSLSDIENTVNRSEAKGNDAKTALSGLDKKNVKPTVGPTVYNQVVLRISEGVQYLKDANTFLKEIMYRITHS